MTIGLKLATPNGYEAFDQGSILGYLQSVPAVAQILGEKQSEWSAEEVGDGNLNLVFIVKGPEGSVCVKQALPYVRLVGESWPLPLSRAHYEHLALLEQAKHAPGLVPKIYHYDETLALIVMEFLNPHIILRKGLIESIEYPNVAKDIGIFLARTLYLTSDLNLDAAQKKDGVSRFLGNTAMCKITEDVIFDEPYFESENNRHTSPQLDNIASEFRSDATLKAAVQGMKWKFQNHAEALIHGDLHTGSVMVTDQDTRIIDPEFAFYGPMGFDTGAIIANFLIAYFAQPGHEDKQGDRAEYREWILRQIHNLWAAFSEQFMALCHERSLAQKGGDIDQPRLCADSPELREIATANRLESIWRDTVGFAGCKIIRRVLGIAHVDDFESIPDKSLRAACERRALECAYELIVSREVFVDIDVLLHRVRDFR